MTIQNDTTKVGGQDVSVQDAAIQLLKLGFSVIPTNPDKTPAIPSWKPYQEKRMSGDEARFAFRNARSLAIVGGKVSGNVECLDFDRPDLYEPFLDTLKEQNRELAAKLVKRGTPSGGYHLIYRCEHPIEGNQKMAVSEDGKDTWIETRGEGGYFLTSPSKGYTVIERSLKDISVLTTEEAELLHTIARSFTDKPDKVETPKEARVDGVRPGDEFNERVDLSEILPKYEWKPAGKTSSGREHWTRPGKDSGTSATLKDGCLYVFSTNTVLPTGSNSAFSVVTYYEHNGDFAEAARALAKEGFV